MKNSKEFYAAAKRRGDYYETLARAVVKQLGGWDEFVRVHKDIANHGIDGGFHGFIYYVDTVKFAKKHLQEILKLAEEQASDIGAPSFIAMFQGFKCMNGSTEREILNALTLRSTDDTVLNCLAWYAAEEIVSFYYND